MKQAREVALDALTACERQGAWSDGYLKKAIGGAKLDGRDAALATRLCFGVLQNRMLMDFYLSKLCATPLHKLEASIRNLLRLGAYQLLYLNRVPDHAAVSEAVSLARKKAKNPRAAGLVNGVLRSLIRQREALEPPADLSTRYSHPQWLVDSFVARLGREEAEALLAADYGEPPTCAQVYTLKISAEELAEIEKIKKERYDKWEWNYGFSPSYSVEKSRRFEGCGKIEVHMNTEDGSITDLQFFGDFFGVKDSADLAKALIGTKLERQALESRLADFDIAQYFHGLEKNDFLNLLLQSE